MPLLCVQYRDAIYPLCVVVFVIVVTLFCVRYYCAVIGGRNNEKMYQKTRQMKKKTLSAIAGDKIYRPTRQ